MQHLTNEDELPHNRCRATDESGKIAVRSGYYHHKKTSERKN